jgi:hypothetical protein
VIAQVGEFILHPFHKLNLSIANSKLRLVFGRLAAMVMFFTKLSDTKAPLPINDSCKVGKMDRIVDFVDIFNLRHKFSWFGNYNTVLAH